jgi:hypothetical protein
MVCSRPQMAYLLRVVLNGCATPRSHPASLLLPGSMEQTHAITTQASSEATPAGATAGVRGFVYQHDQRWLFVLAYLGLAVVLSMAVSLFWLVVVAGVHFLLECGRQTMLGRGGVRDVVSHALWEVKLDVGLVLLALVLALYMDVIFGILGLQSVARAGAVARAGVRLGSRAAAWERNIRTFLLTVDEMARVVYGVVMVRRGAREAGEPVPGRVKAAAAATKAMTPDPNLPPWRARWGIGDRIAISVLVMGLFMMVVAPLLTPHDVSGTVEVLREQLRPFPD